MAIYLYIWVLIIIKTLSFSKNKKNIFIFYIFLVFFIGLRQEIGGDWFNYFNIYNKIVKLQFKEALFVTDPLYGTLNWVSGVFKLGGIYFVNFICAFIFCSSIYFFSKKFQNIWFPVIILYPYTILAVSMGYTRQSVAIAFAIFAFSSLCNNKKIYFLLFMLLGVLFHKSAAILFILLPYVYLGKSNLFSLTYFIILIIIFLFFFYLILPQNNIYLSGAIHSSGSTVRALIHILPLTIYFIYRELFRKKQIIPIRILDIMAIMIMLSLILSVFFSTLADRFSLYLIVFDMIVLSVFLDSLKLNQRLFFIFMLIIINSIVLYVWLFYSPWAQCCWVPYNNLIMTIL
ncbi:EpsG family protein [Xenorhabdus budapestensis]|uniref:EpsG family protein n=1 Tax=Xenorhabdus budapestensis TaxID=290110 RepID=UPI003A8737A1